MTVALSSSLSYNINMEEKEEKQEVQVSELAFRKIVYHLLRYPTSKVTGLLTGSEQLKVSNAYPLFHTPILNPTFSIALDLVESNLPEGQRILGFYELVEGNEFKVGSLIDTNPGMKNMVPMRVWLSEDKQIKTGSPKFTFACPALATLDEGLRRGEHRFLVDMDAHLEEVQLDFRNDYLQ